MTLTVVYIVGARNCGSTMLDALLGAAPGARSLGEVGGFQRYEPDRPCACQQPQPCAACTSALATIETRGSFAAYRERANAPLKERRFFWALWRTPGRRAYARDADSIFDAVAATTGSRILIDSSKNISRAAALAGDSRHDIRVLHLVRDGRGVLRSRRKRAEVDGRPYRETASLAEWLGKNLMISWLLARRLPADRFLLARYEDLLADPGKELTRIGAFADLDLAAVVEAAMTTGVERLHLFEPMRRTDYRLVTLDPTRLAGQRQSPRENRRYWRGGGFLSARWGYDRDQSYLDQLPTAVSTTSSTG